MRTSAHRLLDCPEAETTNLKETYVPLVTIDAITDVLLMLPVTGTLCLLIGEIVDAIVPGRPVHAGLN